MTSLLCAPILVDEVHVALADAEQARVLGADLVEFRIDTLFQGEGDAEGLAAVERLVTESPLPCIVTCRPTWEGGLYDGDDASRLSLYERLAVLDRPPRYVDLEQVAYERSANLRQKAHLAVSHPDQRRDISTGLILSRHDFEGRPSGLLRMLADMRSRPAPAVLKLAWTARSLRDNLELFELLSERDRPTIALAMGRFGLMSRVLAPKFGGFLTFASVRASGATAPGQPTIAELLNLYRYRSINARTKVYGVIGWPVAHSRSPVMHNACFEALDHDGVYLPLPVPEAWEHFKATLLALVEDPRLDFRGGSVTLPHKEHLVRLAREEGWGMDAAVERIGAANTIVVDDDGSVRIGNTDAPAAAAALRSVLDDLHGVRVALLGAGGVARAIAAGLSDAGACVTVFNRTRARAEALASSLSEGGVSIEVRDWDARGDADHDVWVNATSIGMERADDAAAAEASPLDGAMLAGLPSDAVVFDTVYAPLRTRLLRDASARGLRVVSGLTMFVEQGVLQSSAWTGVGVEKLPRGLFERVVVESMEGDGAG